MAHAARPLYTKTHYLRGLLRKHGCSEQLLPLLTTLQPLYTQWWRTRRPARSEPSLLVLVDVVDAKFTGRSHYWSAQPSASATRWWTVACAELAFAEHWRRCPADWAPLWRAVVGPARWSPAAHRSLDAAFRARVWSLLLGRHDANSQLAALPQPCLFALIAALAAAEAHAPLRLDSIANPLLASRSVRTCDGQEHTDQRLG